MKRILPVAVVVGLLLAVAFWWLLGNHQAPPVKANDFDSAADASPTGKPLERESEPRALEPRDTPVVPDAPRDPAPAGEHVVPDADWDEPAITPDYGDGIRRGGAKAVFALRDAVGQHLWQPQVTVQLFRNVGSFVITEKVVFDSVTRDIRCHGASAAGLEPGRYTLCVQAAMYGEFEHEFMLGKGEQLVGTLHTPHSRQIVTYYFTDLHGAPVHWLNSRPHVTVVPVALTDIPAPSSPERILRDPPPEFPDMGPGGSGGFAHRRARGGGGFKTVVATDNGRYYVPVFRGAENTVVFSLERQIWGNSSHTTESTFTDLEYIHVKLNIPANFDDLIADRVRTGEDDPGARSHLGWLQQATWIRPADDEAAVSAHRLVIELEGPAEAVVVALVRRAGNNMGVGSYTPVRRILNQWYVDLNEGDGVSFHARVNDMQVSPAEDVTVSAGDPKVIKAQLVVEHHLVRAPRIDLSPTTDAWAVHRAIRAWRADSSGHIHWRHLVNGADFTYYPAIEAALADEQVVLSASVAPACDPADSRHTDWRYIWRDVNSTTAPALDALSKLRIGSIEPRPFTRGIALRVVGPGREGLPWVEASVIDLEHDRRAVRLRGVETHLAAAGSRPALDYRFGSRFYSNPDAYSDESIDASVMQEFLGDQFLEQTAEPGDLAWYARNNAWYDTHRKLRSDEHGYVVNTGMQLVPGRKYVLYLWSRSRDDLRPDARIVFEATEGLTDIGAINLPGYE